MSCPLSRPLINLHLSKTGGTELCTAVTRQTCRTHGANCARRIYLQDGPWWVPYTDELSSWHKYNFAYPPRVHKNRTCAFRRTTRAVFFNVESPLFDICDGFDYSVTLREPLTRAVSQARELVRWGLISKHQCANYTEWRRVAPALFDNYYVRMLDGEATYLFPPGRVGRIHFKRAQSALHRFRLVTTLDNATRDFKIAFNITMPMHAKRPTSGSCALSPVDALRFHTDNAWDTTLYQTVATRHF